MNLALYEKCKFAMAQLLRTMGAVAPESRGDIHEQIRNAQTRLAEDRFNLAVVGKFSRGKSSLMNAMLHTGRLPMGVEPLTSVITSVSYGSRERVLIRYEHSNFPHETTIESLPGYITQHGNPGNERRVKMAEIQIPAELLRQGFYFIDTPGLGSSVVGNTRTTQSFLPEVDAMILVSGFDDPIDEFEIQALESARQAGRHVFVVLNKEDLVSEEVREKVCSETTARLRTLFPEIPPTVHALSALRAMQTAKAQDTQTEDHSHVPEFQQAVDSFLISEKSSLILEQMYQRLGAIRESCQECAADPEVAALLQSIGEMVDGFVHHHTDSDEADRGSISSQLAPVCTVCEAMYKQVTERLRHFQYELVVHPRTQIELAEAGGLCPLHTWQYESMASPQGVAAGYPALLDRLAEKLSEIQLDAAETMAQKVEDLIPNAERCALCTVMYRAEHEMLQSAADSLDEPSPHRSTNVCLRHMGMVLRRMKSQDAIKRLLELALKTLHRTAQDMSRYAIKHEGLRRYLQTEDEKHAYIKALLLLVGPRTLATPVQVKDLI